MRKLLIAIVLLSIYLMASCSLNQRRAEAEATTVKNHSSINETSAASKLVSNSINNNVEAEVKIIKRFAENYEPRSTNRETIPSSPNPNKEVLSAIDVLAKVQSKEYEKYIVLIFLRLERFHIEHFKQTYDLGDNALAREFYRLIGEHYQPGGEPKFSHLAGAWVKANPKLLDYPLIEKEMKRVKSAEGKIEQKAITKN